ncbi:hypothetical protein HYX02_07010 [Candidatus Woesearchaeota archaeon]|nr:hypothetical protein [Candidatus Woesearchaeota archaeon]
MAFKRYIRKHGKKLGPYYYENVRSPDGKVKTVYIGTNPEHHPKHRIRKPLFFLILVLILILILGGSLFVMQNKAFLEKKVVLQQPDFEIDQILLKVLVKSGEFIEKQIRVMNVGGSATGIDVLAQDLDDIIKIDSPSFSIKPGQTKIVTLNFSSYLPEQKIEQQPGIYIGKFLVKSEKAAKDIPIVVEIETKNVLFDMNLNPVALERRVKQGTDTTIEVRLFNLESIESQNVDVEYFVKDMNGNTIVTESETVVVRTQASFFKTISIPKNLKPGPYVFAAQAKFGNSIGTASYLFDVVGPEEVSFVQFCKNNVLCLGLSIATILLLFALVAYFYFFIGAYLYDKITGTIKLPTKRKEAVAEPKESVFESIKSRLDEWKRRIELRKVEKERQKEEFELGKQREAEQRQREIGIQKTEEQRKKKWEELKAGVEGKKEPEEKISPVSNLKSFYQILGNLKKAIERKDTSKVDDFYLEARNMYNGLSDQGKRDVYGQLVVLYKQRNELMEEYEQQEKLRKGEKEKKQKEENKKREEIEKERLRQQRREKVKELFHKIGLYKTPEEKRQIALQKERERQEKLKKEEELRKQKEAQQRELERQKQLEQKRREEDERKRKQEELKRQKELERQRVEEERINLKELERQKRQELRKQKELGAAQKKAEEELKKQKELEAKKIKEEKAIKKEIKTPKEEVSKKRKDEAEEIEEAIKSLELFETKEEKKAEKSPSIVERFLKKEKEPEIPIGKSKKFQRCYKTLNEVKDAISKDNIEKAKKFYVEARKLYVELDYNERKDVYNELMEVFNKLTQY